MITDAALEAACRKIGSEAERSWKTPYVICKKLKKTKGVFVGSRDDFCLSFDEYKVNTIRVFLELLMRKDFITADKGDKFIYGYRLNEIGITNMLAVSGPDPMKQKKCEVRGQCGHLTYDLYDGICYGCHVRNMVNRQRRGKCKV